MRLGIVGYSTRALVEAASELGYEAISLDAFTDQDTLELAAYARRVDNWPGDLPNLVRELRHNGHRVDAWLLGGGMENVGSCIELLRSWAPVLGPSACELEKLRSARFWQALTADLQEVAFPPCCPGPTGHQDGWLWKPRQGSGGLQIGSVPYGAGASDGYWQKFVHGQVLGITCYIDSDMAHYGGATYSLGQSDWPGPMPFAYRGSIGPIDIAPCQRAASLAIAERVRQQLPNYRGWLQADYVADAAGRLWLLEINPRWTAGMECLHQGSLNRHDSPLMRHLRAWTLASQRTGSSTSLQWERPVSGLFSKAIHYASSAIRADQSQRKHLDSLRKWQACGQRHDCSTSLPSAMAEWSLADVPALSPPGRMLFENGQPVFTVRTRILSNPATPPLNP